MSWSPRFVHPRSVGGERASLQAPREQLFRAGQQSANGALSTFVARELNQPLTAIVANANAALRLLADRPDAEDIKEAVADIVSAALRASEFVCRVRSRFDDGVARQDLLTMDGIIRDVLAVLRWDLRSRHVSVRTDLRSDGGRVAGDALQMQQVILNLAWNATEAMSGVADRPRRLTIRSRLEAANVIVTVADSGAGLDSADIERAFDMFFSTKPGRLGTGLPISRWIIEAHGGRLWAVAAATRGATFSFSVPVVAEPAGPLPKG
jgi:C4-dicarboxylate-specific signal transduction histidine kinase